MANKVVFTFIAQDKYSRIAAAAARATNSMRRSVNGLGRSLTKASDKLRSFQQRVKKSSKDIKEFGTKAAIGVLLPIGLLGNKLVSMASDAEETRSKFATVFRDIGGQAEGAADRLAASYGLAGTQAREMLGDTGDLLTGFGFAQDEALKVSERVNQLAVDLASFTNYSGGAKGASDALTKALLGERESLKSLGIAISEENVKKEIALLMSQGQRFASLRQAKAHATLSLAVKQSGNAIGDFARTSESLANQERVLAARTQDVAEKYGALLMPIKLLIVQGISKLLGWLDSLSPATKKWLLIAVGAVAVAAALAAALAGLAFILPLVAAGAALLLSPFLLIPAAIAAVVAAGVWLYNEFEVVRDVVDTVANAISAAFQRAVEDAMYLIDKVTGAFNKVQELSAQARGFVSEKFADAKSFLGFGGDVAVNSSSRTDINVNLNAPQGAIDNVKSTTRGSVPGMNVGLNMATVGG